MSDAMDQTSAVLPNNINFFAPPYDLPNSELVLALAPSYVPNASNELWLISFAAQVVNVDEPQGDRSFARIVSTGISSNLYRNQDGNASKGYQMARAQVWM